MDMETLLWFVLFVANTGLAVLNSSRTVETLRDGAFEYASIFGALTLASTVLALVSAIKIVQALP